MFYNILNFVTTYLPLRQKPLWHTLWRMHDEQRAVDQVRAMFPLHTTRLESVTGDLSRSHVGYRLLTREHLGEAFWQDKAYDQYLTLQIPGPMVWQGQHRVGSVYDVKFYFKGDTLIDLEMGLFVAHD